MRSLISSRLVDVCRVALISIRWSIAEEESKVKAKERDGKEKRGASLEGV
jgi:hypothetical protein